MTYRAEKKHASASDVDRPVRLLGGIVAVVVLSVVAVVLKAADSLDRNRIERSIVHTAGGVPTAAKPWTASMAARTIDAPRIPRSATTATMAESADTSFATRQAS